MDLNCLKTKWLQEERIAHIHGWDFSHIEGRFEEGQDIPWNYEAIVRRYLSPESRLLDIDTGGGEFLLSLNHPRKTPAQQRAIRPTSACVSRSCLLSELTFGKPTAPIVCPLTAAPLIL